MFKNALKFATIGTLSIALTLGSVAKAPQSKDIVDTAVAAGSFKTLASLLTKAGLVNTLKGDGPFTVFAPTDAAFAKLPKATLDAVGKDKALLTKVLTYHVVAGKVLAKQVGGLKTAKTVQGESIKFKVVGGNFMLNGGSKVTATDILASNGVIHVIDTVLLPPSIAGAKKEKVYGATSNSAACTSCSK